MRMFFSFMMFVLSATPVVIEPTEVLLIYDNDVGVNMPIDINTPDNGVTNICGKIDIRNLSYIILEPKEDTENDAKKVIAVESVNIGYIMTDKINDKLNRYSGFTFAEINILDRN